MFFLKHTFFLPAPPPPRPAPAPFSNSEKVLTNMREITAMAGNKHGKRGQRLDVERVVIHGGYQSDEDPKPHDIALMTLRAPVALGGKMNAICLPAADTRDRGVRVMSAGWGHERTKTSCMTNQMGPRQFETCVATREGGDRKGHVLLRFFCDFLRFFAIFFKLFKF